MKPLDPEALRRLLGFYLDCLEAEDRHGLRIRRAALHHSAVSPWESEPLFHPEAAEVPLSSLKDEERRLLRGVRGLGVPQRFLYGYPMFLDGRGYLLPLFVSVVEVEELPNGRLVMRPSEAGRVLLNHHIFADRGMSREETLLLRETLEGGGRVVHGPSPCGFRGARRAVPRFPRLAPRCLARAGASRAPLDQPSCPFHLRARHLHPAAQGRTPSAGGVPLGAQGGGGDGVGCAGGDGGAHRRGGGRSASPGASAQPRAGGGGAGRALRRLGTGKSQVVVDILASCALAGRPVLFASKNNRAVDVVRERLTDILGTDHDWVLRLGSTSNMREMRDRLKGCLDGLRNSPPPPPVTEVEVREVEGPSGGSRSGSGVCGRRWKR